MKLDPSAGVLTRYLLRRCTPCLAAVAVAGRRRRLLRLARARCTMRLGLTTAGRVEGLRRFLLSSAPIQAVLRIRYFRSNLIIFILLIKNITF